MPIPLSYSGIRGATPRNLVLDAGAMFENINLEQLRAGGASAFANAINPANTWPDPVTAATLTPAKLGATRTGTTITVGKTERQVELDSRRLPIRGLARIDEVMPGVSTSLVELGDETVLKRTLGTADQDDWDGWVEYTPTLVVQEEDYLGNVAIIATVVGEDQPMIVVLDNAKVVEVGDFKYEDKNELVVPVKFLGHALPSAPTIVPIHFFLPIAYPGS